LKLKPAQFDNCPEDNENLLKSRENSVSNYNTNDIRKFPEKCITTNDEDKVSINEDNIQNNDEPANNFEPNENIPLSNIFH